jgi:hypothetical protein
VSIRGFNTGSAVSFSSQVLGICGTDRTGIFDRMKIKTKPFALNQVVQARVSYRPLVRASSYYRVVEVDVARSYSGWMVGVAELKAGRIPKRPLVTLDAGYFQ